MKIQKKNLLVVYFLLLVLVLKEFLGLILIIKMNLINGLMQKKIILTYLKIIYHLFLKYLV